MNPTEKHIIEGNPTSDNVSYLADNEKNLCKHEKFTHQKLERGNWISETMYRDFEKSFNKTHKNTSLHREERVHQLRN